MCLQGTCFDGVERHALVVRKHFSGSPVQTVGRPISQMQGEPAGMPQAVSGIAWQSPGVLDTRKGACPVGMLGACQHGSTRYLQRIRNILHQSEKRRRLADKWYAIGTLNVI